MTTLDLHDITAKLPFSEARKPVIAGIVIVLVMVAVFAGRAIIDTATANEFAVIKQQEQVLSDTAAQQQEAPGSQAALQAAATLYVHVAGAVRNPGLYQLNQGARVADAVNAAGGFADNAVCDGINLARVVSDGEQLIVPDEESLSAQQAALQGATSQTQSAPSSAQSSPAQPSGSQQAGGIVNINKASASELETLPGIGASTAAKIVSDRTANGPFKTCEDLKRVSGIGDKKYEALLGLICV